MEEIFFCPGCMAKAAPINGRCPVCGCDVNIENAPHQLPVNTILYGRYVTGRALREDAQSITYIAYDLCLNVTAAIKEYYPRGTAGRRLSAVFPAGADRNAFEAGRERFIKNAGTPVNDSFKENGTAYIVTEYRRPAAQPKKSPRPALPKKCLIAIGASALVVLAACLTLPTLRNGTDSSAAKQEEQTLGIEELALARESIAAHSETTVSSGTRQTAGIKSDGTVRYSGGYQQVESALDSWTDIIAITSGDSCVTGLKVDGTAVSVGPGLNECGVADWQDILLPLGERKELGTKNKKNEDKKPESAELSLSIDNALLNETTLSTYRTNTVGLRSDGTVVAAGSNEDGECDVSDWRDIIAVSTGNGCIFGLKANGTVIAIGNNLDEQCEVSNWTNIVAVSAGQWHTVGLRADGTVVAVGSTIDGQCSVSGWRDIVAVSAGSDFTAGLRSDGTVVATGQLFDVSGWKDIAAISAGGAFLAGLRPDGTVLVTVPQVLDVSAWTDIVAISAGGSHIVGLRADGTVVAAGFNESSACKVSDWTGIVAVSAGDGYTLGLRADGTVITTKYTGESDYGQCDVTGWKDIRLPVTDSDTDNDIIAAGTL